MTEQQRKDAIEYIEGQLENGYVDLGSHDPDELEIIKEAINLLKTLDKINSIEFFNFAISQEEIENLKKNGELMPYDDHTWNMHL